MTGTQSRKFQLEETDPTPAPNLPVMGSGRGWKHARNNDKNSLITKLETQWYACICVLGVVLGLGSTY